eukprot:4769107-Pyramimonas_sp.AAC.1
MKGNVRGDRLQEGAAFSESSLEVFGRARRFPAALQPRRRGCVPAAAPCRGRAGGARIVPSGRPTAE